MPVKSKAQMRFMQAIAHGSFSKSGLSKEKAKEFIEETPKGDKLPEKKKKGVMKAALGHKLMKMVKYKGK